MSKVKVTVRVPEQLKKLTGGETEFAVFADSVGNALDALASRYNGIGERIFNKEGELNRNLIFTLNDVDIRFSQEGHTRVRVNDVIGITCAIAGG